MSVPVTPKKTKKGDEIIEIAKSLNSKWGLSLPIRDGILSPSKVLNRGGKAAQVYQRIRLLYFKDADALTRVLNDFELRAPHIYSQWIYKPSADSDALPFKDREKSLLRSVSENSVDISEENATKLLDTLLYLLSQVHASPAFPFGRNEACITGERALGHGLKPTKREMEPLSSSGFGSSQAAAFDALLQDMEIPDIASVDPKATCRTTRRTGNDAVLTKSISEDETFTTPPTTPPGRSVHARDSPTSSEYFHDEEMTDLIFQDLDQVSLPRLADAVGKKRLMEEIDGSPISRKMARGNERQASPQIYEVNQLIPTRLKTKDFPYTRASSFSTATTTTAHTSLNTSFATDSTAISFSSSLNRDDTDTLHPVGETKHHLDDLSITLRDEEMVKNGFSATKSRTCPSPFITPPDADSRTLTSGLSTDDYLQKYLIVQTPFSPSANWSHESGSLREIYEISRVALHCNLSPSHLWSCLTRRTGDYGDLWSSMNTYVTRKGKVLPERSSSNAWTRAENMAHGVMLTGEITYNEQPGEPLFKFTLKPLKVERSYRLARKYGSDRFLILGLPGLTANDLPSYLKHDATKVRDAIISWLVDGEHFFLGRRWGAFFIKDQQRSTKSRKNTAIGFNKILHRIYFFATDGFGLVPRCASLTLGGASRVATSVKELITWFMHVESNRNQPSVKLFARLALGVSDTEPTVEFTKNEIFRSDDAFSDSPDVRRLDIKRSNAKKKGIRPKIKPKGAVMNDGCARISVTAAKAIADQLGLQGQVPCVFQGRIGGAKGVWMVDAIDEQTSLSERGFWIEITDSQLKFETHPIDKLYPDNARVTFEVHAYALPPSSSALNYQLMPILVDRGVPKDVLTRLLEEDLTAKVANLEVAMDSALALRKWNQENNSVTGERVRFGKVETTAGLPKSLAETVNWAVEHGFEPKSCYFLKELCYKSIAAYCDRLENSVKIGLGRSTILFMIADPLAVLEEGEVHVGFSNSFIDPKSNFQDTLLNNLDLLVARLPAHLPSDIQKVRAVFKPELAVYKDVIVFSSKGKIPLADKLSGGDYDGDRAWICWENDIVDSFCNAELHKSPDLEYYGLVKDETKIADIIDLPDFTSHFLKHGFDFNTQSGMLGICTHYHDALCYRNNSIDSLIAKDIAVLLGYLVDSAKGGLIFSPKTWDEFRRNHNLPLQLPKPAYKLREGKPRMDNIIDCLVLKAKTVRQGALANFSKHFRDASPWDENLVSIWKAEDKLAGKDPALRAILQDLVAQIEVVHSFWTANCRTGDEGFPALAEQTRDKFLAIRPLKSSSHPMAVRWRSDEGSCSTAWLHLKASTLFQRTYRFGKHSFPWYVCGKELGEIKVRARGGGHAIVDELYVPYRLDAKMVKRLERRKDVDTVVEEDEEFGDEEWQELLEGVEWDDRGVA